MDKEKQNLYVFGYGLTLIIPFLVFVHSLSLSLNAVIFTLFILSFALVLFIVSKISLLKPVYNVWTIFVPLTVLLRIFTLGSGILPYIFLGAAAVLGMATIINVQRIEPFYRVWMKVGSFIGNILTMVVLALLFYCVFGITGIVLRLLRKDLLDRAIDTKKESYWIKRPDGHPNKEDYLRQF